ncbi:MAG: WbuC family cupin fold metalloprotein [Proteobacteria bacterium]|nr:WbuC family cupin fold metalloprotein [Pseudomonadota bacterium]MBU1612513.1 WbuC family cupin fold metalloprotein [Pseudomonadota bacterium]
MTKTIFPTALSAPKTQATPLTSAMLDHAVEMSRNSPRGRIIQRLHTSDDDSFHRMFNAMQPGTYFRPHRHFDPPKAELFLVLRGALRVIIFHDDGTIEQIIECQAGGEIIGVDMEPGVYHTSIVLEPDTIMLECKTGPYAQTTDKDFASWAPVEGTLEAVDYLKLLREKTNTS